MAPVVDEEQDDTTAEHIYATIQALRDSVSSFLSLETEPSVPVQTVLGILERFLKTEVPDGLARKNGLRSAITDLRDGDVALFHFRSQNAGLLITARQDHVLFEAFELLAPNVKVMSCKGALLREFPDRAAVIALDRLRDDGFMDELLNVLHELDVTTAPTARPKVVKAGTVQPEERDTISPLLVTGMLVDVLSGLGAEVNPECIAKRCREQVNWDNARLPFHRSAVWLLLRVAMRLVLDRQVIPGHAKSQYKPVMAYHHARILKMVTQADQQSFPSDKLFSMKAKLVHRIIKLDPMQCHDTKILPLGGLANLSFRQDTDLKLKNLTQHLSWIRSRSAGSRDPMGLGDTIRFDQLSRSTLPALSSDGPQNSTMQFSQLLELEAWVELALPAWLDRQLGLDAINTSRVSAEAALRQLQGLINAYYKQACAAYEGMPDALSVMYLVIMELWMAVDRIVGSAIPLLLDYEPGFPRDTFNPLLLERKEDMSRLKHLQDYLSRRERRATSPYPSAFSGFGQEGSFAVRFYQSSPQHQDLRETIESWAERMKAEKLREYLEMKAKHHSLAADHSKTSCEMYWSSRWREYAHSGNCTRCRLQREMESLRIQVFEWPLPTNPREADATVFEISVPGVVELWRSVTWELVTEVFRERKTRREDLERHIYFANDHSGLRLFLQFSSQLHPASSIKPMEVAHYREKHILEATLENVCVPHAARYTYYDKQLRIPADEGIFNVSLPHHCSYAELVDGSPAEHWVRFSKHDPNHVIASQSECPLDTTLVEYRAFGNLRSCVNLQWANILCQLVIPSLDLNKKATLALILQACLEAGPDAKSVEGADPIRREAHADTQEEVFMNNILQALSDALERVRESWQNDTALCLLTCLATRLLYLSPSTAISSSLLKYLGQLRRVSIAWARLIAAKVTNSKAEPGCQEWARRLLRVALICAATFNMGKQCLVLVLGDPGDLAILVESAALARNHLPAAGRPSDPIALQLMYRWHVAMYQARLVVTREVVEEQNKGLDGAIKQFWADYSPPSARWTQGDIETQSHILSISNSLLRVTFNLLTGNLFVNGYPLSKLPQAYQEHATFGKLFGDHVLYVGPSSIPGMQFSTCRHQHGWIVHFALKDDQLVVRVVRERPRTEGDHESAQLECWEYIPNDNLRMDLPDSFVHDYAHWLDLATGEIEFRPMDAKWLSSLGNWRLTCMSSRNVLKKGSSFVIDPSSPTAELSHQFWAP
ncbi:hypothetical protein MFIFM68171_04916 [Madurella fahalii]|uniref:DUF6606 domain-containing protein n=1 Tax=Madurella fahalii TaxID=1157608 RepID=A0ABQ0GAE8_9PEZI